jgi:hypothetical protein
MWSPKMMATTKCLKGEARSRCGERVLSIFGGLAVSFRKGRIMTNPKRTSAGTPVRLDPHASAAPRRAYLRVDGSEPTDVVAERLLRDLGLLDYLKRGDPTRP